MISTKQTLDACYREACVATRQDRKVIRRHFTKKKKINYAQSRAQDGPNTEFQVNIAGHCCNMRPSKRNMLDSSNTVLKML